MHLFVHRSSQTPLWDLHSYTFVYRDGASPPHIIRISPDALAARLANFHAQTQEQHCVVPRLGLPFWRSLMIRMNLQLADSSLLSGRAASPASRSKKLALILLKPRIMRR
jgi:hypothetical protein